MNQAGGGEAEIYDDSLKRENEDDLENESRKKIKCENEENEKKFRFVPKPETICSSFCKDSNSFIQTPFDEISNIFFDSTFCISEVYTSNGRSLFLIGTNEKGGNNLIFKYVNEKTNWFGTMTSDFEKIDTVYSKMRGKIKFSLNSPAYYSNMFDLKYWTKVFCDSTKSFKLNVSIPDNKWGNICDFTAGVNE